MLKLIDEIYAGKACARLTISADSAVDDIALKVIRNDCPDFLMPMRVMYMDDEMVIRYEMDGGTPMVHRSKKMMKRELNLMLGNLLQAFQDCGDWLLDHRCLLLDAGHILVTQDDKVLLAYIPLPGEANSDQDIIQFITDYLYEVQIADDAVYVMELLKCLRKPNGIAALSDYIAEHSRPVGGSQIRQQDIPQQRTDESLMQRGGRAFAEVASEVKKSIDIPPTKKTEKADPPKSDVKEKFSFGPGPGEQANEKDKKPVFGEKDIEGEILQGLFGEDKADKKSGKKQKTAKTKEPKVKEPKESKGGLLGNLFGGGKKASKEEVSLGVDEPKFTFGDPEPKPGPFSRKKKPEVQEPAVTPQESFFGDDVTTVSDDEDEEMVSNVLRLRLISSTGCSAPEIVELNLERGPVKIGRRLKDGRSFADYCFDSSCNFVSKEHCVIDMGRDGYQIMDINQGNGTYLNQEKMVSNIYYPLKRGDQISVQKIGGPGITYLVL